MLVVESRDIYDQSTKEALLMTTNVISSFLLFLVPLTLTIIAAILNSRRQPEHFMKVLLRDERGSIFLLRGGAGQEIFFSGGGGAG